MSDSEPCARCGSAAFHCCSNCATSYCSAHCQAEAWPQHAAACAATASIGAGLRGSAPSYMAQFRGATVTLLYLLSRTTACGAQEMLERELVFDTLSAHAGNTTITDIARITAASPARASARVRAEAARLWKNAAANARAQPVNVARAQPLTNAVISFVFYAELVRKRLADAAAFFAEARRNAASLATDAHVRVIVNAITNALRLCNEPAADGSGKGRDLGITGAGACPAGVPCSRGARPLTRAGSGGALATAAGAAGAAGTKQAPRALSRAGSGLAAARR